MTLLFSTFLKPCFSTLIVYAPGGSWGATKIPSASVAIVRETPLAGLTILTVAPATAELLLSLTCPVIETSLWPNATTASAMTIANAAQNLSVVNLFMMCFLAGAYLQLRGCGRRRYCFALSFNIPGEFHLMT